ncbi:MAG: hypothetical protein GX045_01735 [Clostridiaceae bacterium]|jgi:lactate dehydrogenase-like 2-hydroxyacid dehydrogenase|nr:hypothetical protein [Clostridiaceae bacterium]
MLSLCRKIAFMDRAMRNGIWISGMLTTEVIGKTVGIICFGNIGKRLAELLTGFHCNILVYDVVKDPASTNIYNFDKVDLTNTDAWEEKVKYVDLYYLIPESDIISLHLPCNEHTRGMVDKNFLRKMKKSAFLINTSRGTGNLRRESCSEVLSHYMQPEFGYARV